MNNYHADRHSQSYFEGWYFKHQSGEHTLAVIPGISVDELGTRTAFVQIITEGASHYVQYPGAAFHAGKKRLVVRVGDNIFSERGIKLDINTPEVKLRGSIRYGLFRPLSSDIMGPFRFLPGMECRHGILSMGHTLAGSVVLNGDYMGFSGGKGYVEKDRGRSFPSSYQWTQCNSFGDNRVSIMMAAARIPVMGTGFRGCICAVTYNGREYRLATYLGARVVRQTPSHLMVRQGELLLSAELLHGSARELRAPVQGNMARSIHEHAACSVRYRLSEHGKNLFDLQSPYAGFEYAGEGSGQKSREENSIQPELFEVVQVSPAAADG